MARILIDIFSLTGSTRIVGEAIASVLQDQGHEVTVLHDYNEELPSPDTYDVIGIGAPTYAWRLPFSVVDRINALESLEGKHFFIFITYGTETGKAPLEAYRLLKKKGGRHIGTMVSRGKDLYLPYLQRGAFFSPDSPTDDELRQVAEWTRKLSTKIVSGEEVPFTFKSSLSINYRFQQLTLQRFLARQFYSRFFKVKTDACISCGKCEKSCPTGNVLLQNGHPRWNRNCILCLNCEMNCPVEAIVSPFDWALFSPFLHANVKSSKKKGVPWTPVNFAKGKVKRVSQ